jgi:hypothetical protein
MSTKGLIIGGRGRHAEALALLECALDHPLGLSEAAEAAFALDTHV